MNIRISFISIKSKSNEYYYKGYSVLHIAKSADMVNFLIKQGASVDETIDEKKCLSNRNYKKYGPSYAYGFTPLHLAVLNEQVIVAKALLANGANVDAETIKHRHYEYGYTPLHLASSEAMALLLISYHAKLDIRVQGREKWTPLQLACMNSHVEVATILLEHNANPNDDIDEHNHTILDAIILSNQPQLFTVLLKHGACFSHLEKLNNRINLLNEIPQEQLLNFIKIYCEIFTLFCKTEEVMKDFYRTRKDFHKNEDDIRRQYQSFSSEKYEKRHASWELAQAMKQLDECHHQFYILFDKDNELKCIEDDIILTCKALFFQHDRLNNIPYENQNFDRRNYNNDDNVLNFLTKKHDDYGSYRRVDNYWLLIIAILHYFSPKEPLMYGRSDFHSYSRQSAEAVLIAEINSLVSKNSMVLLKCSHGKKDCLYKIQKLQNTCLEQINTWQQKELINLKNENELFANQFHIMNQENQLIKNSKKQQRMLESQETFTEQTKEAFVGMHKSKIIINEKNNAPAADPYPVSDSCHII